MYQLNVYLTAETSATSAQGISDNDTISAILHSISHDNTFKWFWDKTSQANNICGTSLALSIFL